ncbi:MAG: ABC transporter ATP-binding protein [Caldilineaceae bacterium]|nr:ABC transporter ATP-binding protein [Caldilineaceae bacterium]
MKSLSRVARYMRPYTWVAIIGFLTVVLPVSMELLVPRLLQQVIDKGIRAQDMAEIVRYSGIMFGSALIGSLATLGQGFCRARISQGIAFDMRNDLFQHIQSLSWVNLDRLQTGQLMTRISSDVDVVRMFASAGLALLIRALLMVFGSLILTMLLDLKLSLIIWSMLVLAGFLIWSIMRLAGPRFTVVQHKLSRLNTIVQENLAGVRVVKAYAREPYEIERFGRRNQDLRDENIDVGRLMATVMPVLLILTNVGSVAVIWWGGLDTIYGRLSVGELIAFNNYLMIGMAPLLLLSNTIMMFSRAEASAERVLDVLETTPAIQPVAQPHRAKSISGRVLFENVTFRYEGVQEEDDIMGAQAVAINRNGQDAHNGHSNGQNNGQNNGRAINGHEDVLRGVSFAVEPGQRIALLGATGAGKSTLIHLLPRFYDTAQGRILVDGVDVREWEPSALRANVGMVLQEATLFSGTIRQNIAYGRPDAPLADVMAAAQAAQAHDFITRMPDGYDSRVEAGGTNLSGGQKQRIAIARALLADPGILVLDDCTSAVDMETEFRIQEALDTLMAGRTTFIIAQRISSVLNADQILVLEKGRISAQGTHAQLLADSATYREIFASQLGVDESEIATL